MKIAVFIFIVVAGVWARPEGGVSIQPSVGYLPSANIGSSLLSGTTTNNFGGSFLNSGYTNIGPEQKQVYFYSAPEDEGLARLRINVAPASHRSTRVIFVKAPSSGTVIPEVNAPPSQAEDKTLVYVLLKKQEQGGSITVPSSLGVKQNQPQVFFIKYKNQAEAEAAVSQGLQGSQVGSNVENLGNEQNFVRTLSDTQSAGTAGLINNGIAINNAGPNLQSTTLTGQTKTGSGPYYYK